MSTEPIGMGYTFEKFVTYLTPPEPAPTTDKGPMDLVITSVTDIEQAAPVVASITGRVDVNQYPTEDGLNVARTLLSNLPLVLFTQYPDYLLIQYKYVLAAAGVESELR